MFLFMWYADCGGVTIHVFCGQACSCSCGTLTVVVWLYTCSAVRHVPCGTLTGGVTVCTRVLRSGMFHVVGWLVVWLYTCSAVRHVPCSMLTGGVTVCTRVLRSGMFRAAVPSGASTGIYEALELRDKKPEYHGKGTPVAGRWHLCKFIIFHFYNIMLNLRRINLQ